MKRRALTILCVLLAGPAVLGAQIERRPAAWAGGGFGNFGCRESFRCDSHEGGEVREAYGWVAGFSHPARESVDVGVEIAYHGRTTFGLSRSQTTLSGLLVFRPALPVLRRQLGIRTTFGFAKRRTTGIVDDMVLNEGSNGVAAAAGIEYELRLLPRLALTPGMEVGTFNTENGDARRMWQYRLAVTWR